ncbi:MAG: hypothetical protein RMJ84_07915, partial [Sandaracinaceae bacterium]|nr:hypothetical protein [Sandaracinaceae bacterium]
MITPNRRKRLSWLSIAMGCGLSAIAWGCGGDGGGGGGGCPNEYEPWLTELAQAICRAHENCGIAGDFETCVSGVRLEWRVLVEAEGLRFDSGQACRCLSAAKRSAQACVPDPINNAPECQLVLRGSKNEGERCAHPLECKAGLFCDEFTCERGGGTCKRLPGRGEGCDGICQNGLACIDRQCVELRKEGESCLTTSDCAVGLACIGVDEGGFGTCKKPSRNKTEGMECDPAGELCQEGLACASDPMMDGRYRCVRLARGAGDSCFEDAIPPM